MMRMHSILIVIRLLRFTTCVERVIINRINRMNNIMIIIRRIRLNMRMLLLIRLHLIVIILIRVMC